LNPKRRSGTTGFLEMFLFIFSPELVTQQVC